jgi:hypothetical protein
MRSLLLLFFLLFQNRIPGPGGQINGGTPPPPTCVTDNFTRANENPIKPPWFVPTGSRTMQILNNSAQATIASPNENSAYCLGGSAAPTDQYSEVTFNHIAGDDFGGPAVRMSNGPTYYVAWARPSAHLIYLYKVSNGALTQMVYFNGTVVSGSKVRLRISNHLLTTSLNGADIGSFTDTAITSGQYGMSIFVTASANDISFSAWAGGAN